MKPSPRIPDQIITVIADGVVIEIACDDDRFEAVLAGFQSFLLKLDVPLAFMHIERGADFVAEQHEAELVRRSAMFN